jgi:hypothetical protein
MIRAIEFRNIIQLSVFIWAISTTSLGWGQDKIITSGYYTMILARNSTMEATEAACIEQAKLSAIAAEFGTIVSETTVDVTNDENGKVINAFTVLTRTTVKGEWLNDIDKPKITWQCNENELSVSVVVIGHVREFSKVGKAEIKFFSCAPNDFKTEKAVFYNNESLNASFVSSQEGYLSVYYVDHNSNTVLRIFPASSEQNTDHALIQANQAYILFNRKKAQEYGWLTSTTELQLALPDGKKTATDEIIAVFSTEAYSKPLMIAPQNQNALNELTKQDFEKWLIELTSRQNEAVVKRVSISIFTN